MTISPRAYKYPEDFFRVSDFLTTHFQTGNTDGNWLQPAWEYMHFHSMLDRGSLEQIGIWEDKKEITAVAHYEWRLGEAFFQVHPDYAHLKVGMLDYAEEHLTGVYEDGRRHLHAYINEGESALEAEAARRGYKKVEQYQRPMYQFDIPNPFPPIQLPDGFRIKSLNEDNDLNKIHRVLWRGFDHPGDPDPADLDGRRIMQAGPNFRHDLTIVVEAPDGNFVSFSGTWLETKNKIAYVEPVATDPDYRRMGLGKAAVLEGIRRCGLEGAAEAFVGSDQDFYQALGFQKAFTSSCWVKTFNP